MTDIIEKTEKTVIADITGKTKKNWVNDARKRTKVVLRTGRTGPAVIN